MFPQPVVVREAHLFTYAIASAEMRYNAIGERAVYLRSDPVSGPVVRGELVGCGPGEYADLSQVLLEYALSCEGCQDQARAGELVTCTGERLGKILATRLYHDAMPVPDADRVSGAFQCILRSMAVAYTVERGANGIRFEFACCPLHDTALKTGLSRGTAIARRCFVALCASMLQTLAPDWVLVQPSARASDDPLREIVVHHSHRLI